MSEALLPAALLYGGVAVGWAWGRHRARRVDARLHELLRPRIVTLTAPTTAELNPDGAAQ